MDICDSRLCVLHKDSFDCHVSVVLLVLLKSQTVLVCKYISLFTLSSRIFSEQRKSCGDELESDGSGTSEGDKENRISLQQRSKSLEVLVDDKQNKALSQQNGHVTKGVSKFNRPGIVSICPGIPQTAVHSPPPF